MKIISIITVLSALLLSFSQVAFAFEEEDYNSYEDYDSIVGDLSNRTSGGSDEILNLDSMKLHAGFGMNNSLINLKSENGSPDQVTLQGFQISLGIDLFSPNVVTEVALMNFNSEVKENHKYSLKEFDLKTYYRHHMNRIVAIRGGAGLGVRYFEINRPNSGSTDYTNPVAQILVGAEAKLGKKLSFVTELTYKNAMSSVSPEKSALDLGFRVDGHF